MVENTLSIVLSGYIRLPKSEVLLPFWNGFIELQRKIPVGKTVRQIVTHSWNPELDELVRDVYAPQVKLHEQFESSYSKLTHNAISSEKVENAHEPKSSLWSSPLTKSLLSKACSRSRAVKLMDELPIKNGQVLITHWDLGQTESVQINQLVADASLSEDYLYLAYFSEVDKGYPDLWLLAPWQIARRFGHFDLFLIDSLTGKNRYLELFTKTGWPRSFIKSYYQSIMSHSVVKRLVNRLNRLIQNYLAQPYDGSWKLHLKRIVRKITSPLQNYLSQPVVTAENSCVPGFERSLPVYPEIQAFNSFSILKYFILSQNLRDKTRFLTNEDFEISLQCGQLINPQQIVLIVRDANDAQVLRLMIESPLPLVALYQISNGYVREYLPSENCDWSNKMLLPMAGDERSLIICALNAARYHLKGQIPALLMPKTESYLGCLDWFYMNALLKFICWKNLDYVGLASNSLGKPSLEFPNLNTVGSECAFSFQMAAGSVKGLLALVIAASTEQLELNYFHNQFIPEFLVVSQKKKLFQVTL